MADYLANPTLVSQPRTTFPRVLVLLAGLPFLLLTAFNQPFFDDFRNAYWVREHGLLGVQVAHYLTWTGRYGSTFVLTVLNPVTYDWLAGVKVVAAASLLGLWLSLAGLLRTLARVAAGQRVRRGAVRWAALGLLALFGNATPAPFSFLYWFAGLVVYQLPLIALLNFSTLALQAGWGGAAGRRGRAWAAGACLLVAVGSNELTLVQAAVVLAMLAATLPPARRSLLFGWGAVAALAAVVALAAPGNWGRVTAMDPHLPHRWLLLGPRIVSSALHFLIDPLIGSSLLLALLAGAGAGQRGRAAAGVPLALSRRQWWGVLLAVGALNGSGFVLFRLLIGTSPLPRALNELVLVAVVSAALLGWLAGQRLVMSARQQAVFQFVLVVGLLAFLALGNVVPAWQELLTSAPAYDRQLRTRYALLRAAHRAGRPATLPLLRLRHARVLAPLNNRGYFVDFDVDVSPGCEGTINGVLSRYFEVPRVCGVAADSAVSRLRP